MAKGHITYTAEVLEHVRVTLIRFEARPGSPSRREIAGLVGREVDSIHKFIEGVNLSSSLAADLIAVLPEIGHGITCPYCRQTLPGSTMD